MPQVYDKTDFAWTSRGDLVIGHSGDIMDTYEDPLRSLYEEVRTRIMSVTGDWRNYPDLGAGLEDYVGEPNNKVTAEALKVRIITAITRNGLVSNSDLEVRYSPIDIDKIMFRISIRVVPTARNAGSDYLGISFLYDYSENHAYFVQ
jgi:hypothetical protein